MRQLKSVITCDLEGRIETFGQGAQSMFGYTPEEIIGKKRVSLFSPGLIVLAHVNTWLSTAVETGKFEGRTVFVRKNGELFTADIRITPTFKGGQQIGYCGVTVENPDVPVSEAMPPISLWTRIFGWLVVTRAPFLTATLLPVLFAGALVAATTEGPFAWGTFGLALLGALALQVAANTFNDYFDWKSGADEANAEYFLPYSGGSRSIELGLITPKGLLAIAWGSVLVASLAGVALLVQSGTGILWFGLAGILAAYFYTAPPLRLVARKGMGELLIGLCFGPLMVGGTVYALTGSVGWPAFAAGIPLGLLTSAILWINEFPDAPSDAQTGKNTLVVVLGKQNARWGYVALLTTAFISIAALVATGYIPTGSLLALLAIPLAVYAISSLMKHYESRELVKANAGTIYLQGLVGTLLALGCLLHVFIGQDAFRWR